MVDDTCDHSQSKQQFYLQQTFKRNWLLTQNSGWTQLFLHGKILASPFQINHLQGKKIWPNVKDLIASYFSLQRIKVLEQKYKVLSYLLNLFKCNVPHFIL